MTTDERSRVLPRTPEVRHIISHNCAIERRFQAIKSIIDVMHPDDAEPLIQRILDCPGEWVLYDPEDDGDGFMIVGDDPQALAVAAIDHFQLDQPGLPTVDYEPAASVIYDPQGTKFRSA